MDHTGSLPPSAPPAAAFQLHPGARSLSSATRFPQKQPHTGNRGSVTARLSAQLFQPSSNLTQCTIFNIFFFLLNNGDNSSGCFKKYKACSHLSQKSNPTCSCLGKNKQMTCHLLHFSVPKASQHLLHHFKKHFSLFLYIVNSKQQTHPRKAASIPSFFFGRGGQLSNYFPHFYYLGQRNGRMQSLIWVKCKLIFHSRPYEECITK